MLRTRMTTLAGFGGHLLLFFLKKTNFFLVNFNVIDNINFNDAGNINFQKLLIVHLRDFLFLYLLHHFY